MNSTDPLAAARAWLADDPDPDTCAELEALLASNDLDALADRFAARLTFGTAGLRGRLGAGPNRMNRLVVRQAAAGLAAHLGSGSVVVAHDARHKSDVFAEDTARVLAAAGIRSLLLPANVPTPVLAFALRRLGADAGVMVTASHNPPGDNGYKVYSGDGAQIVPPTDLEIAAAIEEAAKAPIELAPTDATEIERLSGEIVEDYTAFAARSAEASARRLTLVYTPMHGVGRDTTIEVLRRAGFDDVHVVPAQADPDPDFPTVAFPNPEEPGALDLAMALADEVGADLILANDPDADRLAVAVPGADGWHPLTGDQVGALLGDHMLSITDGSDRLVVNSVVSSPHLARIAARYGARHMGTLTGFKWIVRPALDDPSLRFVFGYEEALGYAVNDYVRDKDGITAAVVFADLADRLAAEGRSVQDRLVELARLDGLHAGISWSYRDESARGAESLAALMTQVRKSPPADMAGEAVVRVIDRLPGTDLPPSDLVELHLAAGRVLFRPSGTEPKLKAYIHVVEDVPDGAGGPATARSEADRRLDALLTAVRSLLGFA